MTNNHQNHAEQAQDSKSLEFMLRSFDRLQSRHDYCDALSMELLTNSINYRIAQLDSVLKSEIAS